MRSSFKQELSSSQAILLLLLLILLMFPFFIPSFSKWHHTARNHFAKNEILTQLSSPVDCLGDQKAQRNGNCASNLLYTEDSYL